MREQLKKFVTVSMCMCLSVVCSFTAFAGEWKQNNIGWWYVEENGSYPVNAWREVNGKWYYFDGVGYMLHDTITPDGYTVGSDGAWIKDETVDTVDYESGNNNSNNNVTGYDPVLDMMKKNPGVRYGTDITFGGKWY